MRVFILTLGTRGDFEPFWALGRSLRARGHGVTMGTSAFHLQDDPDLDWVCIGDGTQQDLVALLRSLASERDLERRNLACGQQWVIPQFESARAAVAQAATGCDYFIGNIKVPLLRGGAIMPGALVSYDPPQTPGRSGTLAGQQHGDALLELVAMPRALVDPKHEWDEGFHFTGFWSRPERSLPRPALLQEFLRAGAPPVVMTMGSMVTFDTVRLSQCFAQALEIANLRGVQVAGWSGLRADSHAMGRMVTVDEVDYRWLFAQAACVVHHGGVGTVASVMEAGVPSVLLPQVPSQQRWAAILSREGVCAGTLDTHVIDPFELAQLMRKTVDDARLKQRALQWQARTGEDGGMAQAVALIEAHAARLAARSASPRKA